MIRVDMRGSGDSDGLCYGEYEPQEQDDSIEVIDWIRKQPWSSGNVGKIWRIGSQSAWGPDLGLNSEHIYSLYSFIEELLRIYYSMIS